MAVPRRLPFVSMQQRYCGKLANFAWRQSGACGCPRAERCGRRPACPTADGARPREASCSPRHRAAVNSPTSDSQPTHSKVSTVAHRHPLQWRRTLGVRRRHDQPLSARRLLLKRVASLVMRRFQPAAAQGPVLVEHEQRGPQLQLAGLPPDALARIVRVSFRARRSMQRGCERWRHRRPSKRCVVVDIPADIHALPSLLQHLSVLDILNAQLASRGLHEALQDERVWHSLCVACWGAHTLPHRWLVPPLPAGPATPTRATLPSPASYR